MERTINNLPPRPEPPRILPLNEKDLYEIRLITDNRAGEIRWFIPITLLGHQDPTRPYIFKGASKIQTPMGPQDISFDIAVETLSDAILAWPRVLEATIEKMRSHFEEARLKALLAGAQAGPSARKPV